MTHAQAPAELGFRLTDEQRELRDAVRTLARERIAPRAADIDRTGEFPWDVKELLAQQDIFALPFPEQYGGLGADLLTLCVAIEEISRGVRHERPDPRRAGARGDADPARPGPRSSRRAGSPTWPRDGR